MTRVFTFMMSREASQRTFPNLDIRQPYHDVSHHANRPETMETHARIGAYFTELIARFVTTLRETPDGDGTLLDSSIVFYGGGMGDGQAHSPYPLPLAAVGRGGGGQAGDRLVTAAEWTSIANLWLGVANLFGVPIEQFGESTGPVTLA